MRKRVISVLLSILTLLLFSGCSQSGEMLLYAIRLGISQADFETLVHSQPKSVTEALSEKQIFYDDVSYNGYSCDMICTFEEDTLLSVQYIFQKSVQWTQAFYLDTIKKLEDKYPYKTVDESTQGINKKQYAADLLTVNTFETDTAYCIEIYLSNSEHAFNDIVFDLNHQPQLIGIEQILDSTSEDTYAEELTQEEETVLCRFLLRMECQEYDLAAELLDSNLNCSLQTIPFSSEGTRVYLSYRIPGSCQIVLANSETGVFWHIRIVNGDAPQRCIIYSYYMTK